MRDLAHEWHAVADMFTMTMLARMQRASRSGLRGRPLLESKPLMSKEEKPTGPASYFPSIEKKYGQPIGHWLNLLKGLKDMKHMEMVEWLKSKHGMGHGHANALVAYLRANP